MYIFKKSITFEKRFSEPFSIILRIPCYIELSLSPWPRKTKIRNIKGNYPIPSNLVWPLISADGPFFSKNSTNLFSLITLPNTTFRDLGLRLDFR